MKQELIDLKNYISGQEICVFSEEEEKLILQICSNIKPFEMPDFVSIIGDTLYIVEHFEFDSSKRKKRSSTLREEIFKDDKRVNEYFKDHNKNDCYVGALSYKTSPELYLKNLFSTFEDHYSKIDSYIKHCKEFLVFKNVKVMFFIVDRTICGNFVEYKGYRYCANAIRSNEFVKFLKDKIKVDYLLVSSEGNNNTKLTAFCSRKLLLTEKIEKINFMDAMWNGREGMATIAFEKYISIPKKK